MRLRLDLTTTQLEIDEDEVAVEDMWQVLVSVYVLCSL